MRAAAARHERGDFALLRLLDPGAIWRTVASDPQERTLRWRVEGEEVQIVGAGGSLRLAPREALEIFFTQGSRDLRFGPLDADARSALEAVLPWPLYVWGFDSI